MEEVKINAIYQHWKGGYYKVVDIAYHHETESAIVIYYKCDENGTFQSIRWKKGNEEYPSIHVKQPFYRNYNEFTDFVDDPAPGYKRIIQRFKFTKQL